jgi:chromate transporter
MAQAVVDGYGWLTPGEMLDALGLAETTPGPLILVNEFVGALAAWRHGGGPPLLMGILGAIVTLWATFAPCFLWIFWIFAGAPYIERLNAEPRLKSALATVTAAVVGVILNLSIWFALHVLFANVATLDAGPLRAAVPELTSVNTVTVMLSAIAFALLFALHRGIVTTLGVCGALALAWHVMSS